MNKTVGIIDEPVPPGSHDNLGIDVHTESLIDFITNTSTPITVGIQGEWGSGKTSLINSIHHAFDAKQDVKQIWINSWEYSLLSTPEETLLKIVTRIIDDLTEADPNQKRITAIKGGAEKIFKGALRVGAGVTMGVEAANVAKELLESSSQTISALRMQLTEVVNEMASRSSNPYDKVIVYVDDLDRIEPKNAVAILELLKNIFSVPKCVFILAIDYQVVVKGLEHKFGPQTPENEWEFRAFFDKIIQLPFMMPMGQYNIGKYVNSLLVDIGFVDDPGLDDEAVRQIILQTIGGNPRSIKRLVNSVSLIQIFIEKRKSKHASEEDDEDKLEIDEEDEKFLMFALLCLQIAFPPIYSLLTQDPNFPNWDDKFAFRQTNRSEERLGDLNPEEMKNIFDQEFSAACATDDFDEDWEKALYRICYGRPRLKPRVGDISKFFSYIKDTLLSDQTENIGSIIASALSQTSVTSVTSTDQGQPPLPEREGAYKRRVLSGFDHWITDKKVNENLTDEQEEILSVLRTDIEKELRDVSPLFTGWMTFYVAKHKFLGAGILTSGKTKKLGGPVKLNLLKHFENEYRIPKIEDIPTFAHKYVRNNLVSTRGDSAYNMILPSVDLYRDNKKVIMHLIGLAYDMALSHWDARLRFNSPHDPDGQRQYIVKSKIENVENDEIRFWELADKYLDAEYTYTPKV